MAGASSASKTDDLNTAPAANPVVVDIGKQKRKQIKQLRQGKGKLLDEINSSIQELRTVGNISATAQPVIVIVREKRRRVMRGGLRGLF